MITFKSYLAEARMAPLYHSTGIKAVDDILDENILKRGWPDREMHWHSNDGKIISLTRNLPFALKWKDDYGVVLELDQLKLSQNYKIVPFSYFARSIGTSRPAPSTRVYSRGKDYNFDSQYEESIVNSDIKNIQKYIVKIIITDAAYSKWTRRELYPVLKHPLLWSYEQKRFINQ